MQRLTSIPANLLLASFVLFSAGCASNPMPSPEAKVEELSEIEKISRTAIDTCGSSEQVETVSETGFVCKD